MRLKKQTYLQLFWQLLFSVGCLGIINNVISAQAVNPEEIVAISSNGDVLDFKTSAPEIANAQNSEEYFNGIVLPDIQIDTGLKENSSETDNIIDPDERIQRMDTTIFPWSTVVKIKGNFGEFSMGCTGWILGPSTVATAAHCIYDYGDTNVFASNVEIIPALNTTVQNSEPFGRCKAVIAWLLNLWVSSGSDQYDYGVYGLNCRAGEQTGNLGYQILADNLLLNTLVNVTGYPDDKGGTTMWYAMGGISSVSNNFFNYPNDTYRGQSGAPVWEFINGGCENCVTAIYHGGVPTFNYGVRINQDVFDFLFVMQQWVYNPTFLPIILSPGNNQDPNTPDAYPAPIELSERNAAMEEAYPAP